MEHLLFAGYLVLFAWLVTKTNFFTRSGLTPAQLIIVFLLKVIAGIFYGWIGVYYGGMAQMVDTWGFHYESVKAWQLLLHSPHDFFTSLFKNTYESGYGNFLSSNNSWWNDLHGNFFIMILSFFNLLSFGNYYTNVVFFSFISLFGPIGIYRVMKDGFPQQPLAVLLATFLLPSFLYWTSGIHKDGLVFVGLALVIYPFYFGFKSQRFSWQRWMPIIVGLVLILAIRNYLLMILFPALLAWYLAQKTTYKPLTVFTAVYAFSTILFFSTRLLSSKLDFPAAVVAKQKGFLALQGGSAVPTTELKPSVASFVKNAPEAFALAVLRPYPSDVKHLLSLAAAVEIDFLLLCFLAFLFWRRRKNNTESFLLFCLFFSFSALLTIGYTVNFLGAIVRYRSIVLPFVVIPLMALIDWPKIGNLIAKKH